MAAAQTAPPGGLYQALQRERSERNGKDVVIGQVLDNFFDRTQPLTPSGSIELQTLGSEVRFRNISVREIGEAEGKPLLATVAAR